MHLSGWMEAWGHLHIKYGCYPTTEAELIILFIVQ